MCVCACVCAYVNIYVGMNVLDDDPNIHQAAAIWRMGSWDPLGSPFAFPAQGRLRPSDGSARNLLD